MINDVLELQVEIGDVVVSLHEMMLMERRIGGETHSASPTDGRLSPVNIPYYIYSRHYSSDHVYTSVQLCTDCPDQYDHSNSSPGTSRSLIAPAIQWSTQGMLQKTDGGVFHKDTCIQSIFNVKFNTSIRVPIYPLLSNQYLHHVWPQATHPVERPAPVGISDGKHNQDHPGRLTSLRLDISNADQVE